MLIVGEVGWRMLRSPGLTKRIAGRLTRAHLGPDASGA